MQKTKTKAFLSEQALNRSPLESVTIQRFLDETFPPHVVVVVVMLSTIRSSQCRLLCENLQW